MTLQQATFAMAFIIMIGPRSIEPVPPSTELAHVSNTTHFEIGAPVGRVAPLFGPEAERCWAGKHWNPEFLYPQPARDIQGAVFQVHHGQHTSVWVNTVFDLPGGRIQYVAFIDGIFVMTLDIELTSLDASHTNVDVTSTRTALQPAVNDDVLALGESDRNGGPDSQKGIEKCLAIEAK
jgi:hypothetical protein